MVRVGTGGCGCRPTGFVKLGALRGGIQAVVDAASCGVVLLLKVLMVALALRLALVDLDHLLARLAIHHVELVLL